MEDKVRRNQEVVLSVVQILAKNQKMFCMTNIKVLRKIYRK